jgi:hypothetical protein
MLRSAQGCQFLQTGRIGLRVKRPGKGLRNDFPAVLAPQPGKQSMESRVGSRLSILSVLFRRSKKSNTRKMYRESFLTVGPYNTYALLVSTW